MAAIPVTLKVTFAVLNPTPIPQEMSSVLSMICVLTNQKARGNLKCLIETVEVKDSHMHWIWCKIAMLLQMAYQMPQMATILITFKVIHLLEAFQMGFIMQHLTRFQPTDIMYYVDPVQ